MQEVTAKESTHVDWRNTIATLKVNHTIKFKKEERSQKERKKKFQAKRFRLILQRIAK